MHIDADALVRKPIDDALTTFPLLDLADRLNFNAAQDWYENHRTLQDARGVKTPQTGVMIIKPDADLFSELLQKFESASSYDDGDQGFVKVVQFSWLALRIHSTILTELSVMTHRHLLHLCFAPSFV